MPEEPIKPDPAGYVVAVDEARRAIDQQHELFKSIRERATALLTLGGVAAAFLGGVAFRDKGPITWWTVVAAVAFAGIGLIVFRVQWPKRLIFSMDAWDILGWIEEEGLSRGVTERTLAYWHAFNVTKNEPVLNRMIRYYQVGICLLIVELIALVVDLRGR